MLSERLSYLFVPSDSERKAGKAFELPTDAIIFDWEDGVLPGGKGRAREVLGRTLGSRPPGSRGGQQVIVRCNPVGSPFFAEDLALIKTLEIDGVMIPKCEDSSEIGALQEVCPHLEILPLIESARGVLHLEKILAAGGKISRVAFGAVDFAADLRVPWTGRGREFDRLVPVGFGRYGKSRGDIEFPPQHRHHQNDQ